MKVLKILLVLLLFACPAVASDYFITDVGRADIELITTATTPDPITINNTITAPATMTVDWGDGTSTIVTGNGVNTNTTHDYPGAGGAGYRIKIRFSNGAAVTRFDIGDENAAAQLHDFRKITGVQILLLYGNTITGNVSVLAPLVNLTQLFLNLITGVTGEVSVLAALPNLVNLRISGTGITGAVSDFATRVNWLDLRINDTAITGDIADVKTLVALNTLYLYSTSINTYTQGALPVQWDTTNINISNLGLDQTEVDNFLCDLNTASVASAKTLTIKTGNAASSGAGDACELALEGKGWTVN